MTFGMIPLQQSGQCLRPSCHHNVVQRTDLLRRLPIATADLCGMRLNNAKELAQTEKIGPAVYLVEQR